jgi:hypothetical protein
VAVMTRRDVPSPGPAGPEALVEDGAVATVVVMAAGAGGTMDLVLPGDRRRFGAIPVTRRRSRKNRRSRTSKRGRSGSLSS